MKRQTLQIIILNQKKDIDMKKSLTKEYKREYQRKWQENNREKIQEYCRNQMKDIEVKHRFGSVERYEEAMLKYDGWCAFACDKKAEMIHHLDGKSIHNSSRKDVDNSLKNLLPLCRSCHAKLHHPIGYTRQRKWGIINETKRNRR